MTTLLTEIYITVIDKNKLFGTNKHIVLKQELHDILNKVVQTSQQYGLFQDNLQSPDSTGSASK